MVSIVLVPLGTAVIPFLPNELRAFSVKVRAISVCEISTFLSSVTYTYLQV